MYGYIYKTENLITGDIYIGQHKAKKFEPEKYIGSDSYFDFAIKRYGRENFICEIIEEADDARTLNILEAYYICYYLDIYKIRCVNLKVDSPALKFPVYVKKMSYSCTTDNGIKLYENEIEALIKKLPDVKLVTEQYCEDNPFIQVERWDTFYRLLSHFGCHTKMMKFIKKLIIDKQNCMIDSSYQYEVSLVPLDNTVSYYTSEGLEKYYKALRKQCLCREYLTHDVIESYIIHLEMMKEQAA